MNTLQNSDTNVLMEAALKYAEKGWPVFPCNMGKKPMTVHGFYDATCDVDQIKAWWTSDPDALIGCRIGEKLGVWVLDVDFPEGAVSLAALEEEHDTLPATVEQRTGSGGRHLFFKRVEGREVRNSVSMLGPNLDVRGEGGYVILPPSGHECGGTYEWVSGDTPIADAPEWLIDLVAPLPKVEHETPVMPRVRLIEAKDSTPYGKKALEEETTKVAAAVKNTRNDTLNKAAFALGQLIAGGEIDRHEAESALFNAAVRCGLTDKEARKTLTSGMTAGEKQPRSAPAKQTEGAQSCEQPAGAPGGRFNVRTNGVYFIEVDDEGKETTHWVCSPLHILARTRDADSLEWGYLLEVVDPEGKAHQWAMPSRLLASYSDGYRSELRSLGLSISPNHGNKRLGLYLETAQVNSFARCVDRIGWHGNAFVLPDAVLGEQAGEVVVPQGMPSENPFRQKGTLEEWQTYVGRLCAGNSRLVFGVSMALAATLLDPLDKESWGANIVGASSIGKTTALRVGGSVCGGGGKNGYIKQWRATDNGLEGIAAGHCDALLCLDEMGQADAKVVSASAYMLANGQGKGRMGKDSQIRKSHVWNLLFLSTGEVTLNDKLAEAGKGQAKAGQTVRVVDIPADAKAGFGLFEELHGCENAEHFARQLKEAANGYYGTAFRAFLEALVKDRENITQKAREFIRSFETDNCPQTMDADGQVKRVCGHFALVAAAGEVGVSLGILPWVAGEATKAVAKCFRAWIEKRGGTGAAEVTSGMAQVRQYFQQHGASRFELLGGDDTQRIINRAGYLRRLENGDSQFLVFAEAFRSEVCRGFDTKMICSELKNAGILLADKGHNTKLESTPEGKRIRMFVLTSAILGGTSGEGGDMPDITDKNVEPVEGGDAVTAVTASAVACDWNRDDRLDDLVRYLENICDSSGVTAGTAGTAHNGTTVTMCPSASSTEGGEQTDMTV